MTPSSTPPAAPSRPADLSLAELLPVLLVWLVLALLPLGRLSELPLLAAAIWGLWLCLRQGRALCADPGVRLAVAVFACYWLPAVISAIDAVEPGKTWPHVLGLFRFAPFAVFVAARVRSVAQWQWLLRASALLVAVWLLDAWLQALTGVSLGGPMDSDRLSGIFGADNLKLGGVLAALSPLLLAFAHQRLGMKGVWLAGLLLAGAVLLAGARAAWLVYLLVLAGWCLWPPTDRPWRARAWIVLLLACGAAVGYGAYHWSPEFAGRMDRTLHLAAGNAEDVDHALAGRLPIWRAAAAMALAHPVNGVGVRGFRHAYAEHAVPDDVLLAQGGALHPHQLLLEVASETGLVGLLAWALAFALLLRATWRARAFQRGRALPPLLALAAMCFPLNTHYAFYSSWWGLFFWWLLAIAIAALHLRQVER